MESNQGNPGSFMDVVASRGGPALKQLFGMGGNMGGALNQNTQSPNAVAPSAPPQGGAMPQGGKPSGGLSMASPSPAPAMSPGNPQAAVSPVPTAPTGMGMPPSAGTEIEKQIILKAMDGRLKSLSKIEEAQAGIGRM